MKQLLGIYLNWRIDVLLALSMVALILFFGVHDNAYMTLAIKFSGIIVCGVIHLLFKRWEKSGKIDELLDMMEGK